MQGRKISIITFITIIISLLFIITTTYFNTYGPNTTTLRLKLTMNNYKSWAKFALMLFLRNQTVILKHINVNIHKYVTNKSFNKAAFLRKLRTRQTEAGHKYTTGAGFGLVYHKDKMKT